MYEEGMDMYYIPSSDFHGSEYMHPHFKCREFLSGFDGSDGDMLVSREEALLWADSRYYLQAEDQLRGSGIKLMKSQDEGVPSVIEYIKEVAGDFLRTHEDRFVIGFDGRVTPAAFALELEDAFSEIMESDDAQPDEEYGRLQIKSDEDLVGSIWPDKPELSQHEIFELPITSAGVSFEEKLAQVRYAITEKDADYLLLSDLMEIAWLFNLRGSDIDFTPVFYAYALISRDAADLYLIRKNALKNVKSGVGIRDYDNIYEDLADIPDGSKVWMDLRSANYELYTALHKGVAVYDAPTPAGTAKMIKNADEIEGSKRAHIRDGAAVTRFIKWIKEAVNMGDVQTEISASEHLESLRTELDGFLELSFPTIAGYGPNAAIVHYEATADTNAEIKPEGFFLVDSGAQYIDGTTDITRTIAMGPLTQEMMDDYTYILKSHIAFARLKYREEMSGEETNALLRKPMEDAGLGFKHGIGHGVGHVLGVHEDAAVIKDLNKESAGIKAGMIMSDEPGFYKEGEFGIRIENLILFKDDDEGGIINEPLTCVPYEREAINKKLLTEDEIEWLDNYHAWVRETLTHMLDNETAVWLKTVTEPL